MLYLALIAYLGEKMEAGKGFWTMWGIALFCKAVMILVGW